MIDIPASIDAILTNVQCSFPDTVLRSFASNRTTYYLLIHNQDDPVAVGIIHVSNDLNLSMQSCSEVYSMLRDQLDQFSRIENCRLLNSIVISEDTIFNQKAMINDITNFVISNFEQ